MPSPLVSVICLCYNHAPYVEEAIESVINQTYSPIQLIVVDDASTDRSTETITKLVARHPQITFVQLSENIGNCAAFNEGLGRATGSYVIDLAADDVLMPERVADGVNALEAVGKEYGVQFSDAQLIDEAGLSRGLHSDNHPHKTIPQGEIYVHVIGRYFICGPTMMIRREVLDVLGGYDVSLAYEDFDFWIRSSRSFKYVYLPKALVKRRILGNSMRTHQFKKGSPQLLSTFKVCEKVRKLNKSKAENQALGKRIRYELWVCIRLLDLRLAVRYLKLWASIR